jgi:hypothetical protein
MEISATFFMGFNHGVPPQKVDAVPVYEYQVGYIICMKPAYVIYIQYQVMSMTSRSYSKRE